MEKITLNSTKMTIEEAFEYFIFAKNAQGLTEKTMRVIETIAIASPNILTHR